MARGLSLSLNHTTSVLKLAELGWLDTQINAFIERQAAEATYGVIETEYFLLLATLEENTTAGGVDGGAHEEDEAPA